MANIVFANETMVATVAENLPRSAAATFSMISRICYKPGQQRLFRELEVDLPESYDDTLSDVHRRASYFARSHRFAQYVEILRLRMGRECDDAVCSTRIVHELVQHLSRLRDLTVSSARWTVSYPLLTRITTPFLHLDILRLHFLYAQESCPFNLFFLIASCDTLELAYNVTEHLAMHLPAKLVPVRVSTLIVRGAEETLWPEYADELQDLPIKDVKTLVLEQFEGVGVDILTNSLRANSYSTLSTVEIYAREMESCAFSAIFLVA